jgi:hypothetical protein
MTPEEHDAYIERIKEMQDSVSEMDVTSLELTAEEQDALDTLTEEQRAKMADMLASYQPTDPRYDFREMRLNKGVALFILEVLPVVTKAYKIGEATV